MKQTTFLVMGANVSRKHSQQLSKSFETCCHDLFFLRRAGGRRTQQSKGPSLQFPPSHTLDHVYYMALSHKDWQLPNSRI